MLLKARRLKKDGPFGELEWIWDVWSAKDSDQKNCMSPDRMAGEIFENLVQQILE